MIVHMEGSTTGTFNRRGKRENSSTQCREPGRKWQISRSVAGLAGKYYQGGPDVNNDLNQPGDL